MTTPSSTIASTIASTTREQPGGRILLRLPKSLHTKLVDKANEEGVSLNQFLVYLVTMGLSEWDPKIANKQRLRAANRRAIKSGLLPGRSTYIPNG